MRVRIDNKLMAKILVLCTNVNIQQHTIGSNVPQLSVHFILLEVLTVKGLSRSFIHRGSINSKCRSCHL